MSATPLVSVIIPCFNAERFIVEAIDSALTQHWSPLEVIVIDDGSTDGSRAVLERYRASVRVVYGPNKGASAARNEGTLLAQGLFLQYLDADDRLLPGAIEKRVEALLRDEADIAYSGWRRLQEQPDGTFAAGEAIDRTIESVDSDPAIAWLKSFWCPPAALLYRKSLVTAIGGWNPRLPVVQDARFGLDAALHGGRFVHVPGIGAEYRVCQGSLSRRDPAAFVMDVYRNAREVELWWASRALLGERQRAALAQVYNYTARGFFVRDYRLFRDAVHALYAVEPGFRFSWPKTAGLLASVLGPGAARRVMQWVRSGQEAA
jgi:glycosyltransferase involved in cell wall biosynthesis